MRPLKSKTAVAVQQAIKNVFETGNICRRFWTDAGGEFNNKILREYLLSLDVHMFIARSESKSVFAERFIKSLKLKLFRYLYNNQTYIYIDALDDIVLSYNNTYHSSIKMAPTEVTDKLEFDVYERFYMPEANKVPNKQGAPVFAQGDFVRVSYAKDKFRRSYQETYSEEYFMVIDVIHSVPYRYILEDLLGERIKGSFYSEELQLYVPHPDVQFKIDKVLKYRKGQKGQEALVRWYGYSPRFDSWIPASELSDYKPS